MTVLSITEDTRDLAFAVEVDELDYLMKTTRKFDIIFSEGTDPVLMPIEAFGIVSVTGSIAYIPMLWDPHPYDPWAYVVRKSGRSKGGYNWEVICEYERQEEPLVTPYRLSYTYAHSHEAIDKDREGQPITNSSLETPDPPLVEEYTDLVMRFEVNWPTIDRLSMAEYGNVVNSDWFFGYAPGTCLVRLIEANEVRIAGLWYFAVVIEIHVRPDGWKKRFLDEGYRIIVKDANGNPEKDDDGNLKFQTLTDTDGNPLTAPVMLDGTGSRLAEGATPVYREYQTKKEKPFSIFELYPR